MARKKYTLDDYGRRLILERYDSSTKCITELQRTLGVPRGAIHKWAYQLGVTRRTYQRWTKEDLAYIEKHAASKNPQKIADYLGRSKNAVQVKMCNLGLAVSDGYTLADVQEGMGCSHTTAIAWVKRGWLKGTRRAFDATTWNFTDAQIRDFIRSHPEEIDLSRVDHLWFLDICLDLGRLDNTYKAGTDLRHEPAE